MTPVSMNKLYTLRYYVKSEIIFMMTKQSEPQSGNLFSAYSSIMTVKGSISYSAYPILMSYSCPLCLDGFLLWPVLKQGSCPTAAALFWA
jgi:hypothetical protein